MSASIINGTTSIREACILVGIVLSLAFNDANAEFGFTIDWAKDFVVVLEASTDLAAESPLWTVVDTVTLTDGSAYFSDAAWASHSN